MQPRLGEGMLVLLRFRPHSEFACDKRSIATQVLGTDLPPYQLTIDEITQALSSGGSCVVQWAATNCGGSSPCLADCSETESICKLQKWRQQRPQLIHEEHGGSNSYARHPKVYLFFRISRGYKAR